MKIRSLVTALALGLLASAGTAQANTVEVEIGVAPPPVREYVIPPPRVGYIYENPHYRWEHDKYVWNEGRWIEERHGHRYEQPQIVHRGDHWYFRGGHWDDD